MHHRYKLLQHLNCESTSFSTFVSSIHLFTSVCSLSNLVSMRIKYNINSVFKQFCSGLICVSLKPFCDAISYHTNEKKVCEDNYYNYKNTAHMHQKKSTFLDSVESTKKYIIQIIQQSIGTKTISCLFFCCFNLYCMQNEIFSKN